MVDPGPRVSRDGRASRCTVPSQAGSWRMATLLSLWIRGNRGHFGNLRHGCDELDAPLLASREILRAAVRWSPLVGRRRSPLLSWGVTACCLGGRAFFLPG